MSNINGFIMTQGVSEKAIADIDFRQFVSECLKRHINGDWGNICEEDMKVNEKYQGEELSEYEYAPEEIRIWIKSERGTAVILFPEEY